ncbi:unnamed protein product [Leptidea sinapis]|uniref:Uncharacterized protein n=1 Tax=Leptidea sinapis TaxID=189913 RepID=A0A5E4PZ71_9NEOP|nr:unnamed protein product [Leptidea sinapis]
MYSLLVVSVVVNLFLQLTSIDASYKFHNADLNTILKYLQEQQLTSKGSVSKEIESAFQNDYYDRPNINKNLNSKAHNLASYWSLNLDDGTRNLLSNSQSHHHSQQNNNDYDDARSQDKPYSKVYLILDPKAKLSSHDVKGLSDLVSSWVSPKASKQSNVENKQHYYKGFVVKDNDSLVGRRSRDSNESK